MANNATVGILRALLTANTAEFETAMKRAADAAKTFSRETKQIGRDATQLGASLTKTLTLPIVAVGGAVAKFAIDFESSFAGVRKTVNASEAEFAQMAQAFRDLSKTIPVNVNELNRLGEAAGALGIPKGEIVDFARVMAELGVTTNLTSDQAAESIAKIQNIFGAAGKDTERFASTLVALGNDGASTETQIVEMATRIAGAGHAINMSQGEVLAFASALSSVGIEAEMGGSAISRVFIDIASAVSKGGDNVKKFAQVAGVEIKEFSRLFKEDAATAVRLFIEGLGKIKDSGGNVLGTLEKLGFTEIRVRDTLLRAAGAGKLLGEALDLQNKAWQENSALTEEAKKRFETTSSQLTLLWNRVKDVGITLGNALLPMIQSTVGLMDRWIPVIESLAKGFVGLPKPVQALGVGLLVVAAAAGPLIYTFGQLALAASAIAGAFTKTGIATRGLAAAMTALRVSMGFLLSGPALIIGTIVAIGAALDRLTRGIGKLPPGLQQVQDDLDKIKNKAGDIQLGADIELPKDETAAAIAKALGLAMDEESEASKALIKAQAALAASTRGVSLEQQRLIALYDERGLSESEIALLLGVHEIQVKKVLETTKELAKHTEALARVRRRWAETEQDILLSALAETNQRTIENFNDELRFREEHDENVRRRTMSAYDFQRSQIAKWRADEIRQLQLRGGNWTRAYNELIQIANDKTSELALAAFFDMGKIEPPSMDDLKRVTKSVAASFQEAFTTLPAILIKSFTGGGGLKGAFNAIGAQIGSSLFSVDQFDKQTGKLIEAGSKIGNGIAKLLPKAFASAIPAIGALIGPGIQLLWNGIKKLFGGPSAEELAGRDVKKQFQDSFGSFEDMLGEIATVYQATGRTAEMARRDVERLMAAEKQGAEAVKKIRDEINKAFEEHKARWDATVDATADLTAFTKDGIDSLGKYNIAVRSAVVIFDAWVAKTGNVIEALEQIGPTLDQLDFPRQIQALEEERRKLEEGGISDSEAEAFDELGRKIELAESRMEEFGDSGGEAIEKLLRLREVTQAQKPLMDNIGQSTRLLESLGKAGLLTNDLIIAFGQNAVNQFTLLKGATGSAKDAMVLMQPELQALWEHQEKFGRFADEATQALIDQAEAEGVVGPHMKTHQEQLLGVMEEIRDVLLHIAGIEIPDKTFRVTPDIDPIVIPDFPPRDDDGALIAARTGGLITSTGINRFTPQYLGTGGMVIPSSFFQPRGSDTRPAMLAVGEEVTSVNDRSTFLNGIAMIHADFKQLAGQLSERQDVVLMVDGREVGRTQIRLVDNGGPLRTEWREALGVT